MQALRSHITYLAGLLEFPHYEAMNPSSLYLLKQDFRILIDKLNGQISFDERASGLGSLLEELNQKYLASPLYTNGKAYKQGPSQE